jgi:hypothetical protein
VFKNDAIANDGFDDTALINQLYPDQGTHKKKSSGVLQCSLPTRACRSELATQMRGD